MSFIDTKLRFAFIHVSKTSSIIEWTWRSHYNVVTQPGESRIMKGDLWIAGAHDNAGDLILQQPVEWGKAYKVGFVRNPWAWWLSAYHWYNPPRHTGFDFETRFPTFREFILRWQEWKQQFPWGGYTSFLCESWGQILVDRVCRTERLQEEFDDICKRTGFPQQVLPTKGPPIRYQDYYDAQTRRVVERDLSPRDIQTFGYRFDE
jgi:hypothetical protein